MFVTACSPEIGSEFNHGARYRFSLMIGGADFFNKLATRAEVYDLYYIQAVIQDLFFRAGYVRISYDCPGSGLCVGDPGAMNGVLDNYYLFMDVLF
ncbi:MAG: DUF3373 domain-containing protein [Proteobacteria bacterium]|nr:DUF3373 domain-containing protein [Pseudomonadota bacterium]MBU1647834.1 DUF3373 domain-containing protein [Pseudomonadota bacterium]MBU1985754.1 DUF3373 domain-containing protein [Pseudomonadota bacterium]